MDMDRLPERVFFPNAEIELSTVAIFVGDLDCAIAHIRPSPRTTFEKRGLVVYCRDEGDAKRVRDRLIYFVS